MGWRGTRSEAHQMDDRTARKLLRTFPGKFGRRAAVQLGQAFVFGGEEMVNPEGEPLAMPGGRTPLVTLVGNDVAFKTYLTLVLMTKSPPHDLYRPRMFTELAEILAYEVLEPPDYRSGPGTRRVKRAMTLLHKFGLIKMTTNRGEFSVRVTHMPNAETPPFISLPTQLWSHGWLLIMKPPALAVYMYLRFVGARKGHPVAIDPYDRARTGLSDDTVARGLRQLGELGIVDQRPAVIEDRYGRRRTHPRALLIDDDRIVVDTGTEPVDTRDRWDEQWAAASNI